METKRNKARLTPREQQIVDLMISDKLNKEIADELFIDVVTVDTHLRNMRAKYFFKTTRAFLFWLGEKEGLRKGMENAA